jgi:hypothetical protein
LAGPCASRLAGLIRTEDDPLPIIIFARRSGFVASKKGDKHKEKTSMSFTNWKSRNARPFTFARAAVAVALMTFTLKAQFPNPIQAAKDALNKAKQQTKRGAQPVANTPATNNTPAANSIPTANTKGAISTPPGTKIEATLLSPPLPGAGFAVSPLGIHMATLAHIGSRSVVIYNNVEGPKFDQIVGGNTLVAFAFSSDGSHFAYCGQQGNAVVVMEDGKEIWRSEIEGGISAGNCGVGDMHFTSSSKHLYFEANTWILAPARLRYSTTVSQP